MNKQALPVCIYLAGNVGVNQEEIQTVTQRLISYEFLKAPLVKQEFDAIVERKRNAQANAQD